MGGYIVEKACILILQRLKLKILIKKFYCLEEDF